MINFILFLLLRIGIYFSMFVGKFVRGKESLVFAYHGEELTLLKFSAAGTIVKVILRSENNLCDICQTFSIH